MNFLFYSFFWTSAFLGIMLAPIYAQGNPVEKMVKKAEKNKNITKEQQEKQEILAQKKKIEKRILKELDSYSNKKILPNFDFMLGISTGISLFVPQELKIDIENWADSITDGSNAIFPDKNPYVNYKKKNIPPFFFDIDFRFFHQWYGFGLSYQRLYVANIDYRISEKNNNSFKRIYTNPVFIKYKSVSNGFHIGPWLRKKIYIKQVQLLGSVGYSFAHTYMQIDLEASSTFRSASKRFTTITHGFYSQIELMAFYKNLTYGVGVLFEQRNYKKFANKQGEIFIGQNKKVLSFNLIESPMIYLRIGVSF